jgi:hypothetical protein
LDFFATFDAPLGSTKIMPIPYHTMLPGSANDFSDKLHRPAR